MDFQEKIALIEDARKKYSNFERDFREYLALGNSLNGAYNYFSVEEIQKHEKSAVKVAELEAWNTLHGAAKDSSPVALSEDSIKPKLEKLNDSTSNPTRNKGLPKHKNN